MTLLNHPAAQFAIGGAFAVLISGAILTIALVHRTGVLGLPDSYEEEDEC